MERHCRTCVYQSMREPGWCFAQGDYIDMDDVCDFYQRNPKMIDDILVQRVKIYDTEPEN